MTLRVLHVAESMASGVETAVSTWIEATPMLEHAWVSAPSHEYSSGALLTALGAPSGARSLRIAYVMANLRRTVAVTRPHVIHLHSSFAGVIGRLSPSIARDSRLVYSPHCFGFERRDASGLGQRLSLVVEQALARRCSAYVSVSVHEQTLSRRLAPGAQHHLVPNYVWRGSRPRRAREGAPFTVAAMGRVGPQKDPNLFGALASRLRGPEFRFVWIGGGSSADEERLRQSGCAVTGWKLRREAVELLRQSDVYVHTAAWEGFPLAVPEAAGAGLPCVVRRIPATQELPSTVLFSNLDEAERRIRQVAARDWQVAMAQADLARYLAERSEESVRAGLLQAYGVAP